MNQLNHFLRKWQENKFLPLIFETKIYLSTATQSTLKASNKLNLRLMKYYSSK